MRWDAVAAPELERDLILFDGDCVLCSRRAHFVHNRDQEGRFKFTAIQSDYGRALAARFDIDPLEPQTNLAVIDGRVLFKSDMALAVLAHPPGWGWTRVARILPRALRKWLYDRIARNRYRLFGKRERCWVDNPALKARIVERAT
jgi:predicted DCC family thiol-disulfide oxidoreductase YuxK